MKYILLENGTVLTDNEGGIYTKLENGLYEGKYYQDGEVAEQLIFDGIDGPEFYAAVYSGEEQPEVMTVVKIVLENEGITFTVAPNPDREADTGYTTTGYTTSFSFSGTSYDGFVGAHEFNDLKHYIFFTGPQEACVKNRYVVIIEISEKVADEKYSTITQIIRTDSCEDNVYFYDNVWDAKESGYYGYRKDNNKPFKGKFILRGDIVTCMLWSGSSGRTVSGFPAKIDGDSEYHYILYGSNIYGQFVNLDNNPNLQSTNLRYVNVRYYDAFPEIVDVEEPIPGVKYNRAKRKMSYNANKKIVYDISGKTADASGIVEILTWEEFGITDKQFAKYVKGFNKHAGRDWYRIKIMNSGVGEEQYNPTSVSIAKYGWIEEEPGPQLAAVLNAKGTQEMLYGAGENNLVWDLLPRNGEDEKFAPNTIILLFYVNGIGFRIKIEKNERGKFVTILEEKKG